EFEPRQLFQHQTIAELATVVKIRTTVAEEQSLIEGPVPLTPTQRLFFERNVTDPQQVNQSLMLEVRGAPKAEQLRAALQHLYLHHDALRLRFERSEAGWQQFNEGAAPREIFSLVDLSHLPEDEQTTAMRETVAAVRSSLELSHEPLLKAVLFERGAARAMRLLLVVHYLVADGVSWRILLEDLQKAYAQLNRGEALALGPKTSSFKQWAEKLVAYAGAVESSYWLHTLNRKVSRLPSDHKDQNVPTARPSVVVKLAPEETNALLEQVLPAYRVQLQEVLLTAAVQSFKSWTGQPLLVDLEVHGREDLLLELNLTRTVGRLSAVYPVLLDVEEEATPGEALNSIKEQLRAIPGKGIGYGVLRYLSENGVAAQLQALPVAEVSFNCLGQLSQTLTDLPMFGLADEFAELNQQAQGWRGYAIELNGGVFDGELRMTWTYSEGLHRRSTIEKLAESFLEALRNLIEHCEEEGGAVIPSDFPLARLDQHKLSKITQMISREDESDPWTA
ncbi:MAG TPA: condensation domain-containing protein, partial [Pyrinomonadaceae bacterium]